MRGRVSQVKTEHAMAPLCSGASLLFSLLHGSATRQRLRAQHLLRLLLITHNKPLLHGVRDHLLCFSNHVGIHSFSQRDLGMHIRLFLPLLNLLG